MDRYPTLNIMTNHTQKNVSVGIHPKPIIFCVYQKTQNIWVLPKHPNLLGFLGLGVNAFHIHTLCDY